MSKEKFPTSIASKEEETKPVQEQPKSSENQTFNPKDLEKMSHEEQVAHFDSALSNLDLMSEDVNNALAESELERSGRKGVIGQSSGFDRTSLKLKNFFGGEKAYDEKLSKMAKKVAEKNLDGLERGLGSDVLELKKNISAHDTAAKNNLEIAKEMLGPQEFSDVEAKMNREKDELVLAKNEKENELKEEISQYPAEEKYEKIGNLLGEYNQIESSIKGKRSNLENDIKNHEKKFSQIIDSGDSSKELKEKIQNKIDILKKQHEEIASREKDVKARIDALKSNQKELDPFVKRLRAAGKTKTEIAEAEKIRAQKSKEAPTGPASSSENKGYNPWVKTTTEIKPDEEESALETPEEEKKINVPGKHAKGRNKKDGLKSGRKSNKESKITTEEPSEKQKEDIKLQHVKKSPKQWGFELQNVKNGIADYAGIKKIMDIFKNDPDFMKKTEISGYEAANFLKGLLINKKIPNAHEKAREAIRRLIS